SAVGLRSRRPGVHRRRPRLRPHGSGLPAGVRLRAGPARLRPRRRQRPAGSPLMRLNSLILGAACALALSAPALAQELTAITGGRVLTGTSVIENGTVVIRDGRVVSVGAGAAPSGATVIDARGKVVAPGFVAVDSGLGGSEISSVGGSDDLRNGANSISA